MLAARERRVAVFAEPTVRRIQQFGIIWRPGEAVRINLIMLGKGALVALANRLFVGFNVEKLVFRQKRMRE